MSWLSLPVAFALMLITSFLALSFGKLGERRHDRDSAVGELLAALPGHDCGLCGYADCRRFAKALASGEADHRLCAPAGAEPVGALVQALGRERSSPRTAFVRCAGGDRAAELFSYVGAPSCDFAARFHSGGRRCAEACLGYGDCAKACPLGAISIVGGAAVVDPEACNGCGLCPPSCPKGLIELVQPEARWQVACATKLPIERRTEACPVSCTACGECVNLSTEWQFSLVDGLAKATGRPPHKGESSAAWERIAEACPSSAITGGLGQAADKKRQRPAS